MTGLCVRSRKRLTIPYIVSEPVTVPPGEFTRSTTAFTSSSAAARSICWLKRETGFSVACRSPPL